MFTSALKRRGIPRTLLTYWVRHSSRSGLPASGLKPLVPRFPTFKGLTMNPTPLISAPIATLSLAAAPAS